MMDEPTTETGITRGKLMDDSYNADQHDVPFDPFITDENIQEAANVDGWDFEGHINQTETEMENYELSDGEWVHTGSDSHECDYHRLVWQTDRSLPSFPDTDATSVIIEYEEKAMHFEAGEPSYMGPGYVVIALAGNDGEEMPVGNITLGTFENLAVALDSTVRFLTRIARGDVPEHFDPGQSSKEVLDDLFTSLDLPESPDR